MNDDVLVLDPGQEIVLLTDSDESISCQDAACGPQHSDCSPDENS